MPTSYLPAALLLDFGGVIVETSKNSDGRDRVTTYLQDILRRTGWEVDPEYLRRSLDAGLTALKHWKHASSRRREPKELAPRDIIGDFIVPDLPAGPRAALIAEAAAILSYMNTAISSHTVRPGIRETLQLCKKNSIPVGIVSNAHAGQSHRAILAQEGLSEFFAVQVYSDEVGIRKPHPNMLHLAADALQVEIKDCWYVGDTIDRDVAAGRRAGIGAMIVTKTRHTDNPPFPVPHQPDHIFDTPEGLAELLRRARPLEQAERKDLRHEAESAPTVVTQRHGGDRPVLLVDHGGVIAEAGRTHEVLELSAQELLKVAHRAGYDLTRAQAIAALENGRAANRVRKRELETHGQYVEVTAPTFWSEFVGADLPSGLQTLFQVEAHDLMLRYYLTKSDYQLRYGARELLEYCAAEDITVVIVSNTVSGRGVRARLAEFELDHLVDAGVYSDELGWRKPDSRIFTEALTLADANPATTWFLGDKTLNDAAGAQGANIGRRVLVRGGSTDDAELRTALEDGVATDLVDQPFDVIDLLSTTLTSNSLGVMS